MKIIIVGDKSRYQFLRSLLDNLDEVDLSTDELAKETIYMMWVSKVSDDTIVGH